jgi:hypothetical protein
MVERFQGELLLHARVALVAGALGWLVALSAAEAEAADAPSPRPMQ